MIKVGTLCWVVRVEPGYERLMGMVAEVTGPLEYCYLYRMSLYPIAIAGKRYIAPPPSLLPFSDPTNERPEHEPRSVETV